MDIQISGNAHSSYPCDTVYGLLWIDDKKSYALPKQVPYCGEWGMALTDVIFLEPINAIPVKLSVLWLSLYEEKYYKVEVDLDKNKLSAIFRDYADATHIVVGMAPLGLCAVWVNGSLRSILADCFRGNEFKADFKELDTYSTGMTFAEYCTLLSSRNNDLLKQKKNQPNLDFNFFKSFMQQYIYRYNVLFGNWDDEKWKNLENEKLVPQLVCIHDKLYDGTYYKLDDNLLIQYHSSGKPKKLALYWYIGKSEYSAYFWFEDERIREVFDRFYGAHPDTKTDFIIRIDAEQRKYELALYRYGLKEPQIIPEDVYQLLIFKNKFEDYRSENYNQERGAWIW